MHYSTGKPDRRLPCRGIVRQFSAFLVKVAPAINSMKKVTRHRLPHLVINFR